MSPNSPAWCLSDQSVSFLKNVQIFLAKNLETSFRWYNFVNPAVLNSRLIIDDDSYTQIQYFNYALTACGNAHSAIMRLRDREISWLCRAERSLTYWIRLFPAFFWWIKCNRLMWCAMCHWACRPIIVANSIISWNVHRRAVGSPNEVKPVWANASFCVGEWNVPTLCIWVFF